MTPKDPATSTIATTRAPPSPIPNLSPSPTPAARAATGAAETGGGGRVLPPCLTGDGGGRLPDIKIS